MRLVMFYHSLVSDWNHGNAHFLRGVVSELQDRGHEVLVLEPEDGWSRQNLIQEQGKGAVHSFRQRYPNLRSTQYSLEQLDLDRVLEHADAVIVHEWSEPELVRRIGLHRRTRGDYRLLFHDTHHRSVTAPQSMRKYELRHFDGVLAYGQVIRDIYVARGWHPRTFTWHEAADTRVFRPLPCKRLGGDLVWIGNWGDGERTEELQEYLLEPVKQLGLSARVYGVRYPREGREALADAGIQYCGWLANHRVPEVYSQYPLTIHVPRRPYRQMLPGIPTIRVFESLACGIPLITSDWSDTEELFHPGADYLVAKSGAEMVRHISRLQNEPQLATELACHGLHTIRSRHTCSHRVDELMHILRQLDTATAPEMAPLLKLPEVARSRNISSIK